MPKKSKLLDILYTEAKDTTEKKKNKYNPKNIEKIVKPRKNYRRDKIIAPPTPVKTFSIMVKRRDTPGHYTNINYKDSIMNKSRSSPLPFRQESYVTDFLNPQQLHRVHNTFNPTAIFRVGGKSTKLRKSTKSTKSKKSKK
tara:strand:+ start:380 stop:802 length:423 start_codon:yes stop_codon:yes gene_type:complete